MTDSTENFSIAGLAARFSGVLDNWNLTIDQLLEWEAGTVDGGPDGDGYYPLTNHLGVTVSVPCPALLASTVTGPSAAATAAMLEAQAAVAIAEAFAAQANSVVASASISASAAETARDLALIYRNESATYAANAQVFAGRVDDLRAEMEANVALLHDSAETANAALAGQEALTALITETRDEIRDTANTVSDQANAIAEANTTVATNLADALEASEIAVSNAAAAAQDRELAADYLANAIIARDATYVARDVAEGYAVNTAADAANAALWANTAVTSAEAANAAYIAADEARVLAEEARDSAVAIVGGDFVPVSAKATTGEAELGFSDTKYMTPAKTKAAILALAGTGQERFNVTVTATGAEQSVDVGVDVEIDEVLIFENGLEQDGADITKSGTVFTFTRPTGTKMRFMVAGGYRGKNFEPNQVGTEDEREALVDVPVGFIFLTSDTGQFYFKDEDGWSDPTPLTGPQGVQGVQGEPGANAYVVAVTAGFEGSDAEWLTSLKGEKGDQGDQGPKGDTGEIGSLNSGHVTTALGYTPANKAGDTFTGPVAIDGSAGTNRPLRFMSNGVLRWNVLAENEPEIGTDSGSNFAIGRFNDAGAFVDFPLSISRQQGNVILTKLPYVAGRPLGYLGIPQTIQNGNAIIGPSDVGCHLYHSSATTGHVYTIANTGFNLGDTVVIFNAPFSTPLTISGASGVSIYMADGKSTASSRTLAACSSASLTYLESGVWMIQGSGLS